MQRKQSNKEQCKQNTKAGEQELPFVKGLIVICFLLDGALDKTLGFWDFIFIIIICTHLS